MRWERLYVVAPGTLGVTADGLTARLVRLAGPGVRRLRLTDADLDTARAGTTVTRTVRVPHGELSGTFRAFLRPGARDPLPVALVIAPWMRRTGTATETLDDGTTIRVPVVERVGTLIDLLLPAGHVRVRDLEAALLRALDPDTVTASDGRAVPAAASPVGLRLVPAAEVRTPATIYPTWQPPQVITNPEPVAPSGG